MSKKNSKKNVEGQAIVEAQVAAELRIDEENKRVAELEARIAELEARLAATPKVSNSARREQILTVLRNGPMSIKGIALELSTPEVSVSVRNVSSVLTGIRKAGYIIHTDEQGRKYLVAEPELTAPVPQEDEPASFDDVNIDLPDNTEFQESQDHDD